MSEKENVKTLDETEIYYPHESVSEEMTSHEAMMNEKIAQMRKLRGGTAMKSAESVFSAQGELCAKITDDFPRSAFCGMTIPLYSSMSNSQLRTFFTWRTDARRGIFKKTDKSYILLYCFELLNKIGDLSANEAFLRLCEAHEKFPTGTRLSRWIRDFYAFNEVSRELPESIKKLSGNDDENREICEILNNNFDNKLDFLAKNSAYDIKSGSFYTEDTKETLNGAAKAALEALSEYFSKKDIELSALLCGTLKKDFLWKPFEGAVVDMSRQDGFRAARINEFERYCVRRGEPALESFSFLPQRGFIGYVLKSIEARLRENMGTNRKIVPNMNMLLNDVANLEKLISAVTAEEFVKIIPDAVDDFCRKNGIRKAEKKKKTEDKYGERAEYVRKNIEIDVTKLSEIRKRSDEIAEKLIAEEGSAPDEAEMRTISERITSDEFEERISEAAGLLTEKSGWEGFAAALSEEEKEVLKALYKGENGAKYCREKGLLAETVYERINAAALEFTEDIVIENGALIEDYAKEIMRVIR